MDWATPLDLALRGAVTVLALLTAGMVLRSYRDREPARLAVLFAAGIAAHAWCSAPAVTAGLNLPHALLLAVSAGNLVVGWLLAACLFRESFRPRPIHAVSWAIVAAAGFAAAAPGLASRDTEALRVIVSLTVLVFAGLALREAIATWRDDLVDARRRLRLVIVVALVVATAVNAGASILSGPPVTASPVSLMMISVILAALAVVLWCMLSLEAGEIFGAAPAQPIRSRPAPTPALLERLEHVMGVECAYREDLNIAVLASRLGLPEHRLRRLINSGLGHRNFAAFVNGYRIDDAKRALSDPSQAQVPILTIALDTGFGSIGPFNRAFKAQTGLTPSQYRRQVQART
ncbi:MAG: AraC family transcriptional regulator [Pseudomonadota bacterium]